MKITINGRALEVEGEKTILDISKSNGIEIPALCFLEGFPPYGSCLLCIVEVEGIPRLVPSCATKVSEGMRIWTNSERVRNARKLALSLLFSCHWGDCLPPCRMNCPAGVDVEGYIRLIKNGDYEKAYNLIMENLPFPSSVGRVCPAFCEENCRRGLLEGPLAIRELKRFVGDWALARAQNTEHRTQKKDKRVAIVGSGPAGLSCAYYLAKNGYSVVIFEEKDKPGGMLRYGIPEYRLPKAILDKEIERVISLGVEIKTNTRIEKIEKLRDNFDAVFIGIGAGEGIKMGIPGEDLPFVLSGIKLLNDVASGKRPDLGQGVCVIGGGNTAIDCARTSLRLGASNVSILYRRTRDEMPASEKEIEEAIEEGIKIEFLVAPSRVLPDGIECIKMKLGEPDSSGRRRPVPIPGSGFKIKADTIIPAIGQRPDIPDGIKNNGGLILVNEVLQVGDKIFAGGDCVLGPSTVVEAIASGKKASISIMNYLEGKSMTSTKGYNCIREGISKGDIMEEEKEGYKTIILSPIERKGGFIEIEKTMDENSAKKETERCLKCGCEKLSDCLLRKYAMLYKPEPERVSGFIEKRAVDISREDIKYDPNKCILCARCIRVCLEVKKLGVLGFVGRGYTTQIKPSWGLKLSETICDGCLECVKTCPTGAFVKNFS